MLSNGTRQGNSRMPHGIHCAARLIACYAVMKNATLENQMAFYQEALAAAFSSLVRSMEQLGFSEASEIAVGSDAGLSEKQIEMIFNNLSPDHREGLEAIAFGRFTIAAWGSPERRQILGSGVCAIVGHVDLDHWITVEGRRDSGEWATFDPKYPQVRQQTLLGLERGIFIADRADDSSEGVGSDSLRGRGTD